MWSLISWKCEGVFFFFSTDGRLHAGRKVIMTTGYSFVPMPEEEEEKKGPGFSHLCTDLIISDLSTSPSVGRC